MFPVLAETYDFSPAALEQYVTEPHALWGYTFRRKEDFPLYLQQDLRPQTGIKLNWDKKGNGIYCDSKYYFVLVKDDCPLAWLGFEECPRGFVIAQLQGRKIEASIKGIRWEKLLIRSMLDWAFTQPKTHVVRIVKPEALSYYYRAVTDEDKHRWYMHYVVTPKRMGFVPGRSKSLHKISATENQNYFFSQITKEQYFKRYS